MPSNSFTQQKRKKKKKTAYVHKYFKHNRGKEEKVSRMKSTRVLINDDMFDFNSKSSNEKEQEEEEENCPMVVKLHLAFSGTNCLINDVELLMLIVLLLVMCYKQVNLTQVHNRMLLLLFVSL